MEIKREDLAEWFNALDLDKKYTIIGKLVYFGDDKLMNLIVENCNIKVLQQIKEGAL